jgi:hypothetical protein
MGERLVFSIAISEYDPDRWGTELDLLELGPWVSGGERLVLLFTDTKTCLGAPGKKQVMGET